MNRCSKTWPLFHSKLRLADVKVSWSEQNRQSCALGLFCRSPKNYDTIYTLTIFMCILVQKTDFEYHKYRIENNDGGHTLTPHVLSVSTPS
jgi:hypothetical protein